MAKNRYSAEKRQKEIKRLKQQQKKKLRKEQKNTPISEEDQQSLINEYLGIEPEIDTPEDNQNT